MTMTETTVRQQPAAALAADASRLSSWTVPNRALLAALRQHADGAVAQRVQTALDELSGLLATAETRVAFGGHFSCGKSSVINTLTGRQLLPSSRFPETGVPCLLRTGPADQVVVVPADPGQSARRVPFTTEAIAEEVKLIGRDGARRASVLDIKRLDITLRSAPILDGTAWIDSPGSNDSGAMNERAAAAAAGADVLVWVVNSRQPVAEVEQDLLAAHIAAHGPASVVFVINAFLSEDSAAGWDEFLQEDLPNITARIADFVDTGAVAKTVAVMSARAAAQSPAQYGGPQVRALMASLSGGIGEGWRAPASRRFRAVTRLGELDAWLAGLITAERDRLTNARADRDAVVTRTARFTAAAEQRVRQVLARQRASGSEAVGAAARAVRSGDANPAAGLEAALQLVWDRIAAEVASAIAEEAGRHRQHAPGAAALAASIKAAVTGGELQLAGAGSADDKRVGGTLAGAGSGLVAGSVVPLIGHVIGAGVGAVVGYAKAKKTHKERQDAIAAAIQRAGDAAVDALTGQDAVQVITAVVTEACADAAPPQPGDEKLTALRSARAALAAHADELRSARP
jgi:Dynamin family